MDIMRILKLNSNSTWVFTCEVTAISANDSELETER